MRALGRRLPSAARESFARGRTIIFRGEILSKLYLIERGRARAAYETALGPAAMDLRPGDFFGEVTILEGLSSDSLVEAVSGQTVVLGIPIASFRALLTQDDALRHAFHERVAERRTALGAALLGWRTFDPARTRSWRWPA